MTAMVIPSRSAHHGCLVNHPIFRFLDGRVTSCRRQQKPLGTHRTVYQPPCTDGRNGGIREELAARVKESPGRAGAFRDQFSRCWRLNVARNGPTNVSVRQQQPRVDPPQCQSRSCVRPLPPQ